MLVVAFPRGQEQIHGDPDRTRKIFLSDFPVIFPDVSYIRYFVEKFLRTDMNAYGCGNVNGFCMSLSNIRRHHGNNEEDSFIVVVSDCTEEEWMDSGLRLDSIMVLTCIASNISNVSTHKSNDI